MISSNILECIPQNDLDCYYNRQWKQLNKLTSDKLSMNNFTVLQEKIDDDMHNLIIGADYGTDKIMNNMIKFRDSYFNRNDMSEPIINLMTLINKISNIKELTQVIRIMTNLGITTLFTISVVPHFKEPDVYTLAIGEIPLTLESNEMYEKRNTNIIKKFISMLGDLFIFVKNKWNYNISDASNFTKNVIVFEILFSKSILSLNDSHNPLVTHNSDLYQDFIKKYDIGNFWKNILSEYVNEDMYIFYENPKFLLFMKNFIEKMTRDELEMTKDYLVFCVLKKYGIYTSIVESFEKIMFFAMDDKKIFLDTFYETFGYYLQSIYESKNVNHEKNKQIYEMFDNMRAYCYDVFMNSDIFSKKTIYEAVLKLQTLDIVLGKHDYHVDMSNLPNLNNDFYGNLMIINSFHFQNMISLVGQKVKRYYLSVNNDIFSFIVNAYYDPPSNTIFIPTSITNDMFFKVDAEPIYNYGSLGAIMAHEIMHCFDNYGAIFDYKGHLHNWWTRTDYEKYNKEIEKVKIHYSSLVLNGFNLNGEVSMSENIADIAGLKLSIRTYIKTYMPNTDPNNLTMDEKEHLKKFFERWAHTLRTVADEELIKYEIKFDVHPPNIIRINAPFSHINEYYQIYNVQPEHFNYLPKNERTKFMDI
ncbi:putative zinc metalloproteinase [Tupanvirus deep ocean]|uniref:Zinc metalloproteinase n=2 Tax=Tupanvirus TaxID=2094720 RepID=A0AC62A7H9_9VIRU|nr:putative zinc metalloproteinase [Tupanvirus deep ocean]QKU33745.1 putative zinc metalloproteinase [Tupanvirus deep ocean]